MKVKYGEVDVSNPHFLISSHELGSNDWQPIALLSIADNIQDMRLSALIYGLNDQVTNALHAELNFYLYTKGERDPISYLLYHCTTMANIYSNVKFIFVQNINKTNLLYYIKTKSKLDGIFYNSFVKDMQENYLQLEVKLIFDKALNKTNPDEVEIYNKDLNYFYDLIYNRIPKYNGFVIADRYNKVDFVNYISTLTINDFLHILNYLRHHARLIRNTEVMRLLNFYHANLIQHKK